MPVLEINNISKYFGQVKAVDGISFAVERGEVFGFLGPNGAGKTTTIRCVMDFIRPTSGSVVILGKDSYRSSRELKSQVGYLAGSVCLYDNWTGEQHFAFARLRESRADCAGNLSARLKFDPSVRAKNLSSGNRQKLGIILAFMFDPQVVILDEPTNALDPLVQNTVYDIIREQSEAGVTVFMSSHNLAEVERVCSRVGIIRQGRMVAVESIESLKDKQVHMIRASFAEGYDKADFLMLHGAEIVSSSPNELVMRVSGEIAPVLRALGSYRLKDLEVGKASLEEIFFQYYAA